MSKPNDGSAVSDEILTCPECGKPLKAKKSWGGLMACYCRWGGRKPTLDQIFNASTAKRRLK